MRGNVFLGIAILCAALMLFMTGIMALQERKLQQECSMLETEIMLLQLENAQLLDLIAGLQEGELAGPGQYQVVRQK